MFFVGLISAATDNSEYLILSEITVNGGDEMAKKIRRFAAPLWKWK